MSQGQPPFQDVSQIRVGKKLEDSTYLGLCIDEAMRLSPPVGANLPREVMEGGANIDGRYIPAGITVGVSAYSIQHKEEYFEDPFVYRPERWADENFITVQKSKDGYMAAPIPVGCGRTRCVGAGWAAQEMRVVLARLIWEFDMRLSQNEGRGLGGGEKGMGWGREGKNEFQTWERFVSWHEGPMVEFRLRSVKKSNKWICR